MNKTVVVVAFVVLGLLVAPSTQWSEWWDDPSDGGADWWDDPSDGGADWWDDPSDGGADWWDDPSDGGADWWDDPSDGAAGWLDDSVGDTATEWGADDTDDVSDTKDEAAGWWQETTDFLEQAYLGAGDMWRAYTDMREANFKNSDKYFHARGNYDAAQRGAGGEWIAEVISDGREFWQGEVSGRGDEDTEADQFANEWGRSGGDPDIFRPDGLPDKY